MDKREEGRYGVIESLPLLLESSNFQVNGKFYDGEAQRGKYGLEKMQKSVAIPKFQWTK